VIHPVCSNAKQSNNEWKKKQKAVHDHGDGGWPYLLEPVLCHGIFTR
jgi:hypothetical protein